MDSATITSITAAQVPQINTPASVCQLMAAVLQVRPGESVYDPACGSAGMVVALIRQMRARGQHPELVRWSMNDLDPVAVALAGVNLAIHGMPYVTLNCGDALAPEAARPRPSAGTPDPFHASRPQDPGIPRYGIRTGIPGWTIRSVPS